MADTYEVVWSGKDELLPARDSKEDSVWDELALVGRVRQLAINRGLYKLTAEDYKILAGIDPRTGEKVG